MTDPTSSSRAEAHPELDIDHEPISRDNRSLPEPRRSSSPDEFSLTQMQRRLLDFEARSWPLEGAKAQAIAEEFDWTVNQYYFQLSKLVNVPAAAAYQPAVVRRLRDFRDERRGLRTRGNS